MERETGKLPRVLHRSTELSVESEEERSIKFIASDETVDRYGDIVSADGWRLAPFRKNPIFLWQHSYGAPIGTVPKIGVEGDKLIAQVKFAAAGVSKLADELWALVKEKVLRAVSVGFMVESEKDLEYIRDKDDSITGVRYLRQELLELSLVSVPANPNALAVARSLNLSPDFVRSALPLDALVTSRQTETRRRIQQMRVDALRYSSPR
jgi:HK97 family phage prohead protease